jgi:hypothetical protein
VIWKPTKVQLEVIADMATARMPLDRIVKALGIAPAESSSCGRGRRTLLEGNASANTTVTGTPAACERGASLRKANRKRRYGKFHLECLTRHMPRRAAWKPTPWKKGNWPPRMASHYRITHIQQALMLMYNGRKAGTTSILSLKTSDAWCPLHARRMAQIQLRTIL